MPIARIKLYSTDIKKLNDIISQITDIAKKVGIDFKGPINLPTKKMVVSTRKAPDGEGTETWDRWEMRIHKRLIDLQANERALHLILRGPIPADVNTEIQVIE